MTPKLKAKIRIAIAEACGWRKEYIHGNGVDSDVWIDPVSNRCWLAETDALPDYLNDPNAMHKAENRLTDRQWDEYERQLRLVCGGCSYYEGAGKELLHATAAQRAEAFCRTLGIGPF